MLGVDMTFSLNFLQKTLSILNQLKSARFIKQFQNKPLFHTVLYTFVSVFQFDTLKIIVSEILHLIWHVPVLYRSFNRSGFILKVIMLWLYSLLTFSTLFFDTLTHSYPASIKPLNALSSQFNSCSSFKIADCSQLLIVALVSCPT